MFGYAWSPAHSIELRKLFVLASFEAPASLWSICAINCLAFRCSSSGMGSRIEYSLARILFSFSVSGVPKAFAS